MGKYKELAGHPVISQLLSFIPNELIEEIMMTIYKQLEFLLYGVISRCHSLSNLCKSLLFLDKKLMYLDIDKTPSKSTLSDANIERSNYNLYDCKAETIAYLYKRRWSIETLFKSIKQNFELRHFYSDSEEGIKTQV